MSTLLEVEGLGVTFRGQDGVTEAVRGVSFAIDKGETLALVGESGSGKSVTALSILQLLPYPLASHPAGASVRFAGSELIGAEEPTLRKVRGNEISMIFQEPMTSLNPLHTVEKQVNEVLILHKGLGRDAARRRTLELLKLVGIRDAAKRLSAYPHELSGGQRQRVMIAMALALRARGADRRRTDHGPRRHGPGPDPQALLMELQRRNLGMGLDPDHPRSGRGAQDVAERDLR